MKGFAQTHSPMWKPISINRSRRALSNKHHFDIIVHFYPPENPKKPLKNAKNSKKFCKV